MKRALFASVLSLLALPLFGSSAQAQIAFGVGVRIGGPRFVAPPVYYGPRVVAPRVYYGPRVVVPPPIVYRPAPRIIYAPPPVIVPPPRVIVSPW